MYLSFLCLLSLCETKETKLRDDMFVCERNRVCIIVVWFTRKQHSYPYPLYSFILATYRFGSFFFLSLSSSFSAICFFFIQIVWKNKNHDVGERLLCIQNNSKCYKYYSFLVSRCLCFLFVCFLFIFK